MNMEQHLGTFGHWSAIHIETESQSLDSIILLAACKPDSEGFWLLLRPGP